MLKFTIPLKPVTKKNSQQLIVRNGKPFVIPSKQYRGYEKACGWFLPRDANIDCAVNIKAIYYMPTKRRVDITNLESALLDALVKYKVISDDNCNIVVSTDGSRVRYDKENPRTEVEITKSEERKIMREILFRGKAVSAVSNDDWVYGLLVRELDDNGKDVMFIRTWMRDSEGVSSRMIEVVPETVGQYTGVTDEDGNKIFEGDIVKFCALPVAGKEPYIVVYNQCICSFLCRHPNGKGNLTLTDDEEIEVIGNKYDDSIL